MNWTKNQKHVNNKIPSLERTRKHIPPTVKLIKDHEHHKNLNVKSVIKVNNKYVKTPEIVVENMDKDNMASCLEIENKSDVRMSSGGKKQLDDGGGRTPSQTHLNSLGQTRFKKLHTPAGYLHTVPAQTNHNNIIHK